MESDSSPFFYFLQRFLSEESSNIHTIPTGQSCLRVHPRIFFSKARSARELRSKIPKTGEEVPISFQLLFFANAFLYRLLSSPIQSQEEFQGKQAFQEILLFGRFQLTSVSREHLEFLFFDLGKVVEQYCIDRRLLVEIHFRISSSKPFLLRKRFLPFPRLLLLLEEETSSCEFSDLVL